MILSLKRSYRTSLFLLAAIGLVQTPLDARKSAKPVVATAPKPVSTPWLYQGSDIPPDPAWTFGVLPNGVRYAVRHNGVPPGQVSIRVGIDAGALFERDHEQGFAHFIEHLSFRGSKYLSDGEAKRVWQRLGASFGSDTNAVTSHTQTIYKLDLPDATDAGLDESMKILSGMMEGPTITKAEVDAERRTILAELREATGPQTKVYDATRDLFFKGQLLAKRTPIGTVATLEGATPETLRGFHDRWYRPDKAIVVISGDGAPEKFAALIAKHFSGWKPKSPAVPDPDFGKPDPAAPTTLVVSEPGVPLAMMMSIFRPWEVKADTIAYNQGKLIDIVATNIINRRLERRARAGASFLLAQVERDDVSRTANQTQVTIQPLGNDWQKALTYVRAVIADAVAQPATQAEIDREASEYFAALQVQVETERTRSAAQLADEVLAAVNIRETVATAQVASEVFGGIRGKITPAMILDSTRRLFEGTPPRVMLMTPTPIPDGDKLLATALTAPVVAQQGSQDQTPVSFDQLPKLGAPSTVTAESKIDRYDTDIITFSNGTKAILFLNPAEAGRIYVQARFGNGRKAFSPAKSASAMFGPMLMTSSGVGPFDKDALDRLTSGRLLDVGFDMADDAFVLGGTTRAADLSDMLLLMTHQLANPRFDAAPVNRARAALLASYDSSDATAQAVLGREMGSILRGGDKRWAMPSKEETEALTPEAFRKTWEPLLKQGQIELLVFGDGKREDVIAAIAKTIGALPKRSDARITPANATSKGPVATAKPIILHHKGPVDQAAAMIAFPTSGGIESIYESRKLELLSAIFNDRMFDRFREAEGQSYSPSVSSNWPIGMNNGGSFMVAATLKPEGVDRFFTLSKEIAADLAAKPPTADEFARASGPMIETLNRASSGNTFWMVQMAGATRDPRRIDALKSLMTDYRRITADDVQQAAKMWLVPGKASMVAVLPSVKSAAR